MDQREEDHMHYKR